MVECDNIRLQGSQSPENYWFIISLMCKVSVHFLQRKRV